MDEDRSGNINHMEFLQTLKMLHYDIDIEDAEPLLAWFDPEWKGYISYAVRMNVSVLESVKCDSDLKRLQLLPAMPTFVLI
jgi:Ca2+-binding EF-hand superfamily protein